MLMKRMIMVIMVAMLVLAGCNTWRGFGQDVEKAGEAIQRSTK
jgi:predicted small secreted protein